MECSPAPLPSTGGAGRALPQLPRRVLRSGSASLQRLASMVGKSRQIYKASAFSSAFLALFGIC